MARTEQEKASRGVLAALCAVPRLSLVVPIAVLVTGIYWRTVDLERLESDPERSMTGGL